MIQLRVREGSRVVDLDMFNDEPVPFETSFAEIQDITSKNAGGFTQQFALPGSKTNNMFFEWYFNPNSSFDSRYKIEAELLYNGYEVFTGYLRLDDAVETGVDSSKEVFYNVTFYAEVGNLLAKIADKPLTALDTSEYFDHASTWTNIYQSWLKGAYGNGLLNGRVTYPLLNRGYRYNEFMNDFKLDTTQVGVFDLSGILRDTISRRNANPTTDPFYSEYGRIRDNYFAPAVQAKALLECILDNAGFKMESNFLSTNDWIQEVYMPLTFSEDLGYKSVSNQTFTTNNELGYTFNAATQGVQYTYANLVEDSDNLWNTNDEFTPTRDGYHLVEMEFEYENYDNVAKDMYITFFKPGVGFYYLNYDEAMPINDDSYSHALYTQSGSFINRSVPYRCKADTTETISFKVWVDFDANDPVQVFFVTGITTDPDSPAIGGENATVDIRNINVRMLKSPRYIDGLDIDISQEFGDDMLQVDFVSSMLKQFNLVMVQKPNEANVIQVEPFLDWIGKGRELDWTTKVDRSKALTVSNTNQFVDGRITFAQSVGKDTLSDEFKKENEISFGTRYLETETDFRNQERTIASMFTIPQSEVVSPSYDYTLPVYYTSKEKNVNGVSERIFDPIATTPTLIYYAGLRNIFFDREVYINYHSAMSQAALRPNTRYWPQFHHLTYFPVVTFSSNRSLSFNKDQKQGLYKNVDAQQDCYTMFYEDMIKDYQGPEARIVTAEVMLTPEEIKAIDFREIVRIDDTDYRINKLTGFDLNKPSVGKAELLKIYQDIEVEGADLSNDEILLDSCSAEVADIYTTVALTPNVIQFTGLVVQIGGNCYYVNAPQQYNPANTHVAVTLDTANNVPLTFDDCVDCGQVGGGPCVDVINIAPITGTILPSDLFIARHTRFIPTQTQFDKLEEKRFYWNCALDEFKVELTVTNVTAPPAATGWTFLYGNPVTIPTPVNRPGYTIQLAPDCCYDTVYQNYHEIYYELIGIEDRPSASIVGHKICDEACQEPPQPTPTPTVTPTPSQTPFTGDAFVIENCQTGTGLSVTGYPLIVGKVYYLTLSNGDSGCFEVLSFTSSATVTVTTASNHFQDCATCIPPIPTPTPTPTVTPSLSSGATPTPTPTSTTTPTPTRTPSPSATYSGRYQVRDCSTTQAFNINAINPLQFGRTYYLELSNGVQSCFLVEDIAFTANVFEQYRDPVDYDDCPACETVHP